MKFNVHHHLLYIYERYKQELSKLINMSFEDFFHKKIIIS